MTHDNSECELTSLHLIHREVLDIHQELLLDTMKTWPLAYALADAGALSKEHMAHLYKLEPEGKVEVNRLLFCFLWRQGSHGYRALLMALRRVGQDTLAQTLMRTEAQVRLLFPGLRKDTWEIGRYADSQQQLMTEPQTRKCSTSLPTAGTLHTKDACVGTIIPYEPTPPKVETEAKGFQFPSKSTLSPQHIGVQTSLSLRPSKELVGKGEKEHLWGSDWLKDLDGRLCRLERALKLRESSEQSGNTG